MKLKIIALSLLLIFLASTPTRSQAYINPIAVAQLTTGIAAAYATALVLRALRHYFAQPCPRSPFMFLANGPIMIALTTGGSVATATCLISGYQSL